MEILFGVITVIIGIITLWLTFFRKPKKELAHLKLIFKATQQLSLEVIEELSAFIEKHDVGEQIIFEGIKFNDYFDELKRSCENYLSDELYSELDTLGLEKPTIESMIKSLEKQSEGLADIKLRIRLQDKQFSS